MALEDGGQVRLADGVNKVIRTPSISFVEGIDVPCQIDIADNGLIIDYSSTSPLASIVAALTSARDGGYWDGPGIKSDFASVWVYEIGVAENTVAARSSFFGESVDSTTVLVKTTFGGDANLDGSVDSADYFILSTNFGNSGYWGEGDFNYDGVVDSSDYYILLTNFGESGFNDNPIPRGVVPEPAVIGIMVIAAALTRRRLTR